MEILAAIGAKVWGYVVAVGAVAAVLFTAFSRGKSAGKTEVGNTVNGATATATKNMLDASVNAPASQKGLSNALRDPNRGL